MDIPENVREAHMESSENHYGEDVRTLLSWHAPGRPFRKRSRQYFLNILLFMLVFEALAFLFSQYQLMLVILGITFLATVLASVPPSDFHYKVSSEGVKIEDHFYIWQELYDFYFKKIGGVETLVIRTQALIPGELHMPLGTLQKDHVRRVMVSFLPYREIIKGTFMERSADWLSRNFPLEKTT